MYKKRNITSYGLPSVIALNFQKIISNSFGYRYQLYECRYFKYLLPLHYIISSFDQKPQNDLMWKWWKVIKGFHWICEPETIFNVPINMNFININTYKHIYFLLTIYDLWYKTSWFEVSVMILFIYFKLNEMWTRNCLRQKPHTSLEAIIWQTTLTKKPGYLPIRCGSWSMYELNELSAVKLNLRKIPSKNPM